MKRAILFAVLILGMLVAPAQASTEVAFPDTTPTSGTLVSDLTIIEGSAIEASEGAAGTWRMDVEAKATTAGTFLVTTPEVDGVIMRVAVEPSATDAPGTHTVLISDVSNLPIVNQAVSGTSNTGINPVTLDGSGNITNLWSVLSALTVQITGMASESETTIRIYGRK